MLSYAANREIVKLLTRILFLIYCIHIGCKASLEPSKEVFKDILREKSLRVN